jgi:hypothetical protein
MAEMRPDEKRTVVLANWYGAGPGLEKLGFQRQGEGHTNYGVFQLTEQERFDLMKRIFDAGLNVMLTHRPNDELLYVDNRQFQTR